jgi:rhodanese-related sulfurtransferase
VRPSVETISGRVLDELLKQGGATVVDLASSPEYRAGHVPDAWFAVRSRLADAVERLPRGPGPIVLTSPDGVLARFAAADLAAATARPVRLLAGGTVAWRAAGFPLATGDEHLADDPDDVFPSPYHPRRGSREDAFRAYLTWEIDLVRQIGRDGTVAFRRYPQ